MKYLILLVLVGKAGITGSDAPSLSSHLVGNRKGL